MLPEIECSFLLVAFPAVMETKKAIQKRKKKAIQHLSSDKASSVDAIPVVIHNAGGLPMTEKLTYLFQCMWMMEAIMHEFNDAFIIYL